LLLIVTAVNGGANLTPFRTILALSTALLPFALAPVFDRTLANGEPATRAFSQAMWPSALLALAVMGHMVAANHDRIFSELRVPSILRETRIFMKSRHSDTYALGAWIRAEIDAPGYLSEENLSQPFELLLRADLAGFKQMMIEYCIGDPARFAHAERADGRTHRPHAEVIDGLLASQVLITDFEIEDPRLRLIVRLGQYSIYVLALR